MRILMTGGRNFDNEELIAQTLKGLPANAVLVHGAAAGADSQAEHYWLSLGRKAEPHPADWFGPCDPEFCKPNHRRRSPNGRNSYCPAAGVRRNQVMVELGASMVVVFPGDRGTRDMVHRCKEAEITPLYAIGPDQALTNVEEMITRSRGVTESDRGIVYRSDLEKAIGMRTDDAVPRKLGQNDDA